MLGAVTRPACANPSASCCLWDCCVPFLAPDQTTELSSLLFFFPLQSIPRGERKRWARSGEMKWKSWKLNRPRGGSSERLPGTEYQLWGRRPQSWQGMKGNVEHAHRGFVFFAMQLVRSPVNSFTSLWCWQEDAALLMAPCCLWFFGAHFSKKFCTLCHVADEDWSIDQITQMDFSVSPSAAPTR